MHDFSRASAERARLEDVAAAPLRLLTPARLLRWSLGIVYLWFGALKLVNMSPARGLVESLHPSFAAIPLYCALIAFEVGLGIFFLWERWTRLAGAAASLHLLGTLGVFVFAPRVAFLPHFPFLTMEGEFVVKNLVLLAAAGSLVLGVGDADTSGKRLPTSWAIAFLLLASVGLGLGSAWLHERSRSGGWVGSDASSPVHMTAAEINSVVMGRPIMRLDGVVSERCRVVGCWLKLRDETGELFVDLAPAGLGAHGLAIGERVDVLGHIGKTREGELGFVASTILPKGERR